MADVIDLTLSDDESLAPRFPPLRFRPLSETPAGEPSGEVLPEHGLLLDREFGSFSRWGPVRAASFLGRKLSKGGTSQLRRRITSKPPTRNNDHGVLPEVRQIQDYHHHANTSKRRRVEPELTTGSHGKEYSDKIEQEPPGPKTDPAENTSGTGPLLVSSISISAQALQDPQHGRGGNEISKDAMNESLKIALRQQVFPHVNQRLGHYRLSIDNATRRQLGQKVGYFPPTCQWCYSS